MVSKKDLQKVIDLDVSNENEKKTVLNFLWKVLDEQKNAKRVEKRYTRQISRANGNKERISYFEDKIDGNKKYQTFLLYCEDTIDDMFDKVNEDYYKYINIEE